MKYNMTSALQIVRMKLAKPPTNAAGRVTRWVEATNVVQAQNSDGSWSDAPELDPRYNETYRAAPRTGIDIECLAAENASEYVRRTVNEMLHGFSLIGLASTALGVSLAFIPVADVIGGAFFALANLFLAAGAEAVNAAFTEDCYDAIKCALYNAVDTSGRWDETRLLQALDDIHADSRVNDLADTMCSYILYTCWGWVGVSNAGAQNAQTVADCDACADLCYDFDFTANDGGFTAQNTSVWTSVGAYSAGVGWVATAEFGGGFYYGTAVWAGKAIPASTIVKIEVTYSMAKGVLTPDPFNLAIKNANYSSLVEAHVNNSSNAQYVWHGSWSTSFLSVMLLPGYDTINPVSPPGGSATIKRLRAWCA